jgi:hypothetical protein
MKSYINDPLEIVGLIVALAAVIFAGVESLPAVETGITYPIIGGVFAIGAAIYGLGHKGESGLDVDAIEAGGNRLIIELQDGADLQDLLKAYQAYKAEAGDSDDEQS